VHSLIFSQRGFLRERRETSLSYWHHETCLNIDLHGIDIGEESHGDRRLVMVEICISFDEELQQKFFLRDGC
jgi:hypothetical protein